MSKVSLLPSSSTPLMHALAKTNGHAIDSIPVELRTLWDPATCPLALLPYLAHAFSVDRWSSDWTETQKRAVIAASWSVHRHKGTVGSLRRLLEAFNYGMTITEWWQQEPQGERGTFELEITVTDVGITDALYTEVERLINDAKPAARHIANLAIHLKPIANYYHAVGLVVIDTLTVYPGD